MRLITAVWLVLLLPVTGRAEERRHAVAVRTPDGVILTGHVLPVTTDGSIVAGDIAAQTRQVLANLDALLRQHGGSLARAASVHVYLKRADDFAAMNAAYGPHFATDPPARTTIVAGLAHPDALVQMTAVGLVDGAPREALHPKGWPRSPNPYSYGIRSGDTVWLAGLVARRGSDLSIVEGDIGTQVGVIADNAEAILAEAGLTLADVVSSRVFITEAAAFQAMNMAYRARVPEPRPPRATVVCGLMHPAFRVEITLVAARGERRVFTTPRPDGSPGVANPNFSSAMRVGATVWVAGFLGVSESTRDDVDAQTREILATVTRTLTAAGSALDEVTEATVYVTRPELQQTVERRLREAVGRADLPITTVVTGLVAEGGLVEIVVTARSPR